MNVKSETEILNEIQHSSARSRIKMDEFRFIGAGPWINLCHTICFHYLYYHAPHVEPDWFDMHYISGGQLISIQSHLKQKGTFIL